MKPMNACPVEATLELIGGKYKALILWHLSENKLRFSQLKQMVSATPKMLTQQLRELEAQKLIHREVFAVVPPKVEYSLPGTLLLYDGHRSPAEYPIITKEIRFYEYQDSF